MLTFTYPATSLSTGTNEFSIDTVTSISSVTTSNSQIQAIRSVENPTLKPVYVPLGYQPKSVTLSGFLTANQVEYMELMPDIALYITHSDYHQIEPETYWEIENTKTTRDVGNKNLYQYNLSLLQQEHIGVR